MEFHSLDRQLRPPTWAEKDRLDRLNASEINDVLLEPEHAPQGFWENVLQATTHHLIAFDKTLYQWGEWAREFLFAFGYPPFANYGHVAYGQILRNGQVEFQYGKLVEVDTKVKLAAVEHLLDVLDDDDDDDFHHVVNERARWHGVGLRLESRRFLPVTSEYLHQEVGSSSVGSTQQREVC